MFDGIIIGGTSGAGSLTLQQVTDNGNTTTNNVHVNRAFLADGGTGGEVVVKANNKIIAFAEDANEVQFDFSTASGVLYGIKSNTTGNIITDANIVVINSLGVANVPGQKNVIIVPHGLLLAPNFVCVTASNSQAANFLGAATITAGGYQIFADATNITVTANVDSPDDTDTMDFKFLAYILPA